MVAGEKLGLVLFIVEVLQADVARQDVMFDVRAAAAEGHGAAMNQLLPPGGEKENYNVIIVDIFYIFFFI